MLVIVTLKNRKNSLQVLDRTLVFGSVPAPALIRSATYLLTCQLPFNDEYWEKFRGKNNHGRVLKVYKSLISDSAIIFKISFHVSTECAFIIGIFNLSGLYHVLCQSLIGLWRVSRHKGV